MTPTSNQPAFWLEIKKEYIIQNFDSLFRYLKNYNYNESAEPAGSDFNTTFSRLKEVVDDYLEQLSKSTLAKQPSELLAEDLPFAVKVIATYLLTYKEKKGKDDLTTLARLADILLLDGQATTQSIKSRIKKLITFCMCGCKVTELGFSWTNLDSASGLYSMQTLCGLLSHTKFEELDNRQYIFDGKGFLQVRQGGLLIAPMSHTSFRVIATPNYLHVPFHIDIASDSKLKYKNHEELYELCKSMLEKQMEVAPMPAKQESKEYEKGEEVFVQVYRKNTYELYARTIDKNRKKKEGRIKIDIFKPYGLSNYFPKYIEPGDFLLVQISSDRAYPFIIKDIFEDFYHDYMYDYLHQSQKARFVREYKGGMQYLTEHGFLVNVPSDENTEEEQIEARGASRLVEVCASEIIEDAQNKTLASGLFYASLDEKAGSEFEEMAKSKIIRAFAEGCLPEEEAQSLPAETALPVVFLPMLAHSIYGLVQDVNETEERFKMMTAAFMLLTMAGDENDAQIVRFGMEYLTCLARFAQGADTKTLRILHDESMELSNPMIQQLRIVDSLRGYKNEPDSIPYTDSGDEEKEKRINGLIDASNLLIGKINHTEIERIKRKIATELGVADLYENGINGEHNYGEESDKLEFKTSLVYPPNNNMQPDLRTQRANVLKAVCGMLNSDTGGDVLLGVDDYGYARGLDNDMAFLCKEKKIELKSADKMRLYVSAQIDKAFVCLDNSEAGNYITGTRVKCNVEKNPNSKEVIRIKVCPYEYGVVAFADNEHFPENVRSAAFLRRGGQTMRLEEGQCREVREKKHKQMDPDKQKFKELRKAMEQKKVVILKNYQSKDSEKKDRRVEAYQPIEDRHSIVCYDLDRKDLREFKTTRFESVEITDIPWSHTGRHQPLKIDAFDMLERKGEKPLTVKLKLKPLAYNLLIEEYRQAQKDISLNKDADADIYPYVLHTKIYDIKGIGRFYIGLCQEIKLVEGKALRTYAQEYVKEGDIFL